MTSVDSPKQQVENSKGHGSVQYPWIILGVSSLCSQDSEKEKNIAGEKITKNGTDSDWKRLDLARAHGQAPVGKLGGEPQRASWSPGKKNNDLSKTLDKWVT